VSWNGRPLRSVSWHDEPPSFVVFIQIKSLSSSFFEPSPSCVQLEIQTRVNGYSIYKQGGSPILCDVNQIYHGGRDEGWRGKKRGTGRYDTNPFGAFHSTIRTESIETNECRGCRSVANSRTFAKAGSWLPYIRTDGFEASRLLCSRRPFDGSVQYSTTAFRFPWRRA
jgi:hypothetical protein